MAKFLELGDGIGDVTRGRGGTWKDLCQPYNDRSNNKRANRSSIVRVLGFGSRSTDIEFGSRVTVRVMVRVTVRVTVRVRV